jgi:hypothetical protein
MRRRPTRILLNAALVVSLTLCVATAAVWALTYYLPLVRGHLAGVLGPPNACALTGIALMLVWTIARILLAIKRRRADRQTRGFEVIPPPT